MDDVAGCRLIFENINELHKFRESFHKAKFKHKRKNDMDKYDYIKTPNPKTGYRGIHDIYECDANSVNAEAYRGLLIEIQYRTKYQHAWATCVEVVGFITENQPKFQQGDDRFQKILKLASEIISRSFENATSSLPEISDHDLIEDFINLDKEIGFLSLLRGLNAAHKDVSNKKNIILVFSKDGSLTTIPVKDSIEALRTLFETERDRPDADVVLVRGDTSEDIRFAFKNYFSDATDFISLIEKGCETLGVGKSLLSLLQ